MATYLSVGCEIPSCGTADNRYLWKCEGCSRRFHAACVGVQRNQEELIRSFMLPACSECQERVAMELNFKQLLHQQAILAELVKKHTEAIHRSAHSLQKVEVVHEALERHEAVLDELRQELTTAKKINSPTKTVNAIKHHMSSLFDDALNTVKFDMTESVSSLTDSLSRNLTSQLEHVLYKVDEQLEVVNENLMDVAASSKCSAPEILEEVRIIGSEIARQTNSNVQNNSVDGIPHLSLADELAAPSPPVQVISNSGWRFLGAKRVWKHDWTEFDKKLSRREQQQREAARARRRLRNRRRGNNNRINHRNHYNYNNNNSNNYFNTRNYGYGNNNNNINSYYRNNGRINHRNHYNYNNYVDRNNYNNLWNSNIRSNHNNNNSNNYFNTRNYGNNNNNINSYYRNNDNDNGTNNHNSNNNGDHNYNFQNNNINNGNTNANVSNSDFPLPPDRVLLAAAKHQFSRPPSDYRPNIQFERGETLIPHSVYNEPSRLIAPRLPPASCMPCSSQHPCFQRN